MYGKRWTQEEIEYLKDNYGCKSYRVICSKLGRNFEGVKQKAYRQGLGSFKENMPEITYNQLLVALGYSRTGSYRNISWIKNRGLPVRTKIINTMRVKVIRIDDFWKWAEKNMGVLDFSKFDENTLGKEPEWAKEKRHHDYMINRKIKKEKWTNEEDRKLQYLLSRQKYTVKEISEKLSRTDGAVRRRIWNLGLDEKPEKASKKYYTQEEINIIENNIEKGFGYTYIATKVQKTEKALRGYVYRKYGTENLDKVRRQMVSDERKEE